MGKKRSKAPAKAVASTVEEGWLRQNKSTFIPLSLLLVALACAAIATLSTPSSREMGVESNSQQSNQLGPRIPSDFTLMADNADNRAKYEISVDELEAKVPAVKFFEGPPMAKREVRAMGARFRNFYPFDLTMWWDDGTERGTYSGGVASFGFGATNTYTTHTFHFRNKVTDELVTSLTMRDDEHLMIIGPDPSDTAALNSKAYKDCLKEKEFMTDYYRKNGVPWLSYHPRNKPELYIYPADFVGQTHKVRSYIGYEESQDDPIDFDIKVLSTKPRVLLIENLLSQPEIDHIMEMGVKVLRRSSVGNANDGFESNTRTSENGWLRRKSSPLLDRLYYRFADVLRLPDEKVVDAPGGSIENLQFVRYLKNQKYEAHHDFGNAGRPEQRFSTMLIYLKMPEGGGATSFPKAFDGQGINVKPKEGDAVLFYNMLPDGNGDDYSLHSGTAVTEGTKFVCNLWTWDPRKI